MKHAPLSIFLCLIFFCSISKLKAQRGGGPITLSLSCDPLTVNSCNLLRNPAFVPSSQPSNNGSTMIWNAFSGDVSNWISDRGTVDLNRVAPPPQSLTSNSASMMQSAESIVIRIPHLIIGHKYAFSFFRSASDIYATNWYDPFRMRVFLRDCENFTIDPSNYNLQAIPSNAQEIYCETLHESFNGNWKQALTTFTANDTYAMLWVFADIDPAYPGTSGGFLNFAQPELIDITDLTATASQPDANCQVTLTAQSACSITNAQFLWKDQNGTPLGTGSQITINSSAVSGAVSVSMVLPGTNNGYNNCGNNIGGESSVVVAPCICSTRPTISVSAVPNYFPVTQYSNGDYISCGCMDCNIPFRLTTNLASNLQWYRNNVPLNNPPFSTSQSIDISSVPYLQRNEYTVKNLLTGCMSAPVYLISVPEAYISYTTSGINPKIFTATTHMDYGSGTSYSWTINASQAVPLTSLNLRQIQFYFPNNNFPPSFQGTYGTINSILSVTINNSPYQCLNGITTANEYLLQRQAIALSSQRETSKMVISVRPNPSKGMITISSVAKITFIEVYSQLGVKILSKKLSSEETTLNLSEYSNGIYIIKAHTQDGVSIQKISLVK